MPILIENNTIGVKMSLVFYRVYECIKSLSCSTLYMYEILVKQQHYESNRSYTDLNLHAD